MNSAFSLESLLQEAAALADAGQKEEARTLVGQVLRLNDKSVPAWTLLVRLANDAREEVFSLKQILRLDPNQLWASQRLNELQAAPPAGGTASAAPGRRAAPLARPAQRPWYRRYAVPMLIAFALLDVLIVIAGVSLVNTFQQPAAPQASLLATATVDSCQALIDTALQASAQGCTSMGPNQVCYGNTTLTAQLAEGALNPFQQRGDIITVDSLLSLDASPLNPSTNQWGIAIFKLLADLPRTLPGQNVTFMVFGNTSLTNPTGDLQAFYFSSRLGQMACARIPFDGILINMPDGSGISFSANGTDITLLGAAALEAHANEQMTVSVVDGSASVTANGQTQYFGAGQEVQVPMGGSSGLDASGPPSAPTTSADSLVLSCAVLGIDCNPGDVQPVDPAQAAEAIAQAEWTSTPSATPTESPTPTGTATRVIRPSPTANGTLTRTPARSRTATPARTPGAATAAPGATAVPGAADTATTAPPAPADTATDVPPVVCAVAAGSINLGGTALALTVQNAGGTPVTISAITIDWPKTPSSQKIREIHLSGVLIDTANYTQSPSHIPVGGVWLTGQASDRTLPAGSARSLEFSFQDPLQPAGYGVTVTFDNGCSAHASN
jgi:hypothetical protein